MWDTQLGRLSTRVSKNPNPPDAPESAGERKRKEEACVLFAVFYIRMVVEKR
jgi:hypothetical protein